MSNADYWDGWDAGYDAAWDLGTEWGRLEAGVDRVVDFLRGACVACVVVGAVTLLVWWFQ